MNIALVLSGGCGKRMGGETPKQYVEVNGRMIIAYCLETFAKQDEIDAIQIVAEESWQDVIREELVRQGIPSEKLRGFSQPGQTRQWSIINGLKDIRSFAGKDDCVLIHDAARPMLTEAMISECFRAVKGHDGVMPVLKVKDTMYESTEDGTQVARLLERSRIVAGQAPEVFVLEKYYEANRRLLPEQIDAINGSTEPAILAGMDIRMIPGDEKNFKITTPEDMERFRQIIGL